MCLFNLFNKTTVKSEQSERLKIPGFLKASAPFFLQKEKHGYLWDTMGLYGLSKFMRPKQAQKSGFVDNQTKKIQAYP